MRSTQGSPHSQIDGQNSQLRHQYRQDLGLQCYQCVDPVAIEITSRRRIRCTSWPPDEVLPTVDGARPCCWTHLPDDRHGHHSRLAVQDGADGVATEGVVHLAARHEPSGLSAILKDRCLRICRHRCLLRNRRLRHRRDAGSQLEVVLKPILAAILAELADSVGLSREPWVFV
jgi:hypothetical protein